MTLSKPHCFSLGIRPAQTWQVHRAGQEAVECFGVGWQGLGCAIDMLFGDTRAGYCKSPGRSGAMRCRCGGGFLTSNV